MPSTNGLQETLHYLILALKRNESPGLINQQIRVKWEINDSVKKNSFWAALISWKMTNEGFAETGESLKSEARLFISVSQIEVNFLKNSRWSVPKYFCCAAVLGLEAQFWLQKINIVGVSVFEQLARYTMRYQESDLHLGLHSSLTSANNLNLNLLTLLLYAILTLKLRSQI